MATLIPLPTFEDLPVRRGDPPYSAWGLWEKPELGALNYLSDEVVLRTAREEIRTGARVGLNLPLDAIDPPLFGRRRFERRVFAIKPNVINDDEITFNTQGSSQWDSFRHYAYQEEGKFYNGVTQEDIYREKETTVNGIDAWTARGIAGRGVLVDYHSWALRNGLEYDRIREHAITLDVVKKILSETGTTLRKGDIFLLRTGFLQGYYTLDKEAKEEYSKTVSFPGLAQSKEMVQWLWQSQFSAVAADNPGFENNPPDASFGALHPILLAGWGTPIGELFDLDELANECERQQRWTFFLSSSPLNFTGAVGSPPNIMAIF